jgi:hypothetical protein
MKPAPIVRRARGIPGRRAARGLATLIVEDLDEDAELAVRPGHPCCARGAGRERPRRAAILWAPLLNTSNASSRSGEPVRPRRSRV